MDNRELRALAIAGVEAEIARLQGLLSELRGGRGPARRRRGRTPSPSGPIPIPYPNVTKKRTMSLTARRAIAAAQKARWAKYRKAQKKT